MPLRWQTVDLPFGGGIDSKTHPHLLNGPKAAALVNLRFGKSGALERRPDYTTLGTAAARVERLATYRDTLIAIADDAVYQRSDTDTNGAWFALSGGPRSVDVRRRGIVRSEEGCAAAYSAAALGVIAHVWARCTEDDPDVWLRVDDADTGATIYGPAVIYGLNASANTGDGTDTAARLSGLQIHPITVSGEPAFVVLCRPGAYSGTAEIAGCVVHASYGTVTVGSATTFAGYRCLGAVASSSGADEYVYLVAYTGSAWGFVRLFCTSTTVATNGFESCTSMTAAIGVFVAPVSGYMQALGVVSGNTTLSAWQTTSAGFDSGAIAAKTLVTAGATEPETTLFAAGVERSDGTALIVYEGRQQTSDDDAHGIKWIELDVNGDADATADRTVWNVQLHGCPFVDDSDRVLLPLVAPAINQENRVDPLDSWESRQSACLAEVANAAATEARRVAVYQLDVARRSLGTEPAGLASASENARPLYVPRCDRVSSTGPWVLAGAADEIDAGTAVTTSTDQRGAVATLFDLGQHIGTADANGVLVTGGGYLAGIDGQRHAEVMQLPPPTIIEKRTLEKSSSALSAEGTYAIRLCWMWRDAAGNVHRSAPSAPLEVTVDPADLRMYPLFKVAIPAWADGRANGGELPTDVFLEVYGSPGDVPESGVGISAVDGVYYRIGITDDFTITAGSPDTVAPDVPLVQLMSLDDITDASEPWQSVELYADPHAGATGLPLYVTYTTAGAAQVLEHDPTPSPLHVAGNRDRVWLIDSEDRFSVWYSAPIQPLQAPAFSSQSTLRVPTEAGELVALGVLDDLVVFFGESSIHAVEAIEGPDSTGTGAFPPLRRLSREVGCINAASVVTADAGLFFQSRAGIYLLQPGGALAHVGRDIQPSLDGETIVAATAIPTERQVIFDLASGDAFVFDYEHGQWSEYSGANGALVSGAALSGGHLQVTSGGTVYQATDDNDELVGCSLTTGWIKLAGLQGFKAIRKVGILGRVLGTLPTPPLAGTHDFGSFALEVRYNYDEADAQTYTIDALDLFDAELLDPLHLVFRLARPKCTAIKFKLTYAAPTAAQDVTTHPLLPEFSGLALEVGSKKGLRKIALAGGVEVS